MVLPFKFVIVIVEEGKHSPVLFMTYHSNSPALENIAR